MNTRIMYSDCDFTKNDEKECLASSSGYKEEFEKSESKCKSALLPKKLEIKSQRVSYPSIEQGMVGMVSDQNGNTVRRSKRKRIQNSSTQAEESSSTKVNKKVKNMKTTEADILLEEKMHNLVSSKIADSLDTTFFSEDVDMDTGTTQDILPKNSATLLAKQTEFQEPKFNENDTQQIAFKEKLGNGQIPKELINDTEQKQINKSEMCMMIVLNDCNKEIDTTQIKTENGVIDVMKNKMTLEIKTQNKYEKRNKSTTASTEIKEYSTIHDENLTLHNNNATTQQKNSTPEKNLHNGNSPKINSDESKYEDITLDKLYAEIKKADLIIGSLINTKNKENCVINKSPPRSPKSNELYSCKNESINKNLGKKAKTVVNKNINAENNFLAGVKDIEEIKESSILNKFQQFNNLEENSSKEGKEEGAEHFENAKTKNTISNNKKIGNLHNSVTNNHTEANENLEEKSLKEGKEEGAERFENTEAKNTIFNNMKMGNIHTSLTENHSGETNDNQEKKSLDEEKEEGAECFENSENENTISNMEMGNLHNSVTENHTEEAHENLQKKSLKDEKEERAMCFENTETKNTISNIKMRNIHNSISKDQTEDTNELILSAQNSEFFNSTISKNMKIYDLKNDKNAFENDTDELITGQMPMENSLTRSNDNITCIINKTESNTTQENVELIHKKITLLYMSALEYEKENEENRNKRNNGLHRNPKDEDSINTVIPKIEGSLEIDKQIADTTSKIQTCSYGDNPEATGKNNKTDDHLFINVQNENDSTITNIHTVQERLKVNKQALDITTNKLDEQSKNFTILNSKIQADLNKNILETTEKNNETETYSYTNTQDDDDSKNTNMHMIQESLERGKQASNNTTNKLNEQGKHNILTSKIQADLNKDKKLHETTERDLQLNKIYNDTSEVTKLSSITFDKSIDDDQLNEKENHMECYSTNIRNDNQVKNSQQLEKMKLDINRIPLPQSSNDASLYASEKLNKKQAEEIHKENSSIECLYNADKLITATEYLKLAKKESLNENAKTNMITNSQEDMIQKDKNTNISKEKTAPYWDTEESFDMDDDFDLTASQINMIETDEHNHIKMLNEMKQATRQKVGCCCNTHFGLDSITVEIIDQLNNIKESVESIKTLLNAVLMSNEDIKKKL